MAYIYNGTAVSSDDMGRKFNHSYVILTKYGLSYIQGFTEDYAQISVGRAEHRVPRVEFEVVQEYPEVGIMVNYKKTCGLVGRVPRRQWVAGLIDGTLSVMNAAGYSFFGGDGRLSMASAKALYFPDYPPLEKVYAAVSSDPSVALAFSQYYWMCAPEGVVLLFRRGVEMGSVSKEKDTYILNLLDHSCSLEQELKDEIKDVKFTIKQDI